MDIYDALTTARSYKPAYSQEQALRTMEEEALRGWRDPGLVKLFIHTLQGDSGHAGLDRMQSSLNNMRALLLT